MKTPSTCGGSCPLRAGRRLSPCVRERVALQVVITSPPISGLPPDCRRARFDFAVKQPSSSPPAPAKLGECGAAARLSICRVLNASTLCVGCCFPRISPIFRTCSISLEEASRKNRLCRWAIIQRLVDGPKGVGDAGWCRQSGPLALLYYLYRCADVSSAAGTARTSIVMKRLQSSGKHWSTVDA